MRMTAKGPVENNDHATDIVVQAPRLLAQSRQAGRVHHDWHRDFCAAPEMRSAGAKCLTSELACESQRKSSRLTERARISHRRLVCWVALFLSGQLPVRASAEPIIPAREPYLEVVSRLEPWIGSITEWTDLPALSIALVDDQQIVWAKGFGRSDPKKKTPATADTVYRVGSVSKLFTDLAVMQLVEQGLVDLDAAVNRYLPEFAPRNPFKIPITLRQLMSHRAGLVREPPAGHYSDPDSPLLLDVVGSLNRTTLVHEPGARTKYSNAGIAVAGAVVERIRGQHFSEAIRSSLLDPIGMASSSFEPSAELRQRLAAGLMWTYDGQTVPTPTFLLGTGPADNLVSTVNDLGRFISFVLSGGRAKDGKTVIKADTLKSMAEPQFGKAGESPYFGLGFAISKLDGHHRIGHSGAVYGFVTDVEALPDEKLGAVVAIPVDCANGVARHVAETALGLMLAERKKDRLPELKRTKAVSLEKARVLEGRYQDGDRAIELVERGGKLFLAPFVNGTRVEIGAPGDGLVVAGRLAFGVPVRTRENQVELLGRWLTRKPVAKPSPCPAKWDGLIGEYGWDHSVLYILEKDSRLHALIEWFFEYPLVEEGPDRFRFPDSGLYANEPVNFTRDERGRATQVDAGAVVFKRRNLDGENGKTFRIKPTGDVESLKARLSTAQPPDETGHYRPPELVELIKLDPTIKLNIRYASNNNFLGTPLYSTGRAFLQKPAALALVRVHRALEEQGYGLLIHDAYRPWQITKLFWEATPLASRIFVADPAQGSKHNRGAAVDLTLFDRASGKAVAMVGTYDEFSPRSFPDYPGGRSIERWHRALLRKAMEKEGFAVNEFEWWHFDYRDWSKYPILNVPFEAVARE
jgi:CubicO group peptidase (beta-lactamase class C family)/D-alanyl-D-alanine dipeptidase